PGIKTGINIKYDNPKELGADRIVNAVSAVVKYGGPCIVVDFGTATTFSVVSRNSDFIGGAICPGIKTSMDALISSASRLSRFELEKPKKIIGRNTTTNLQSGFINGFIGLVDNLVCEIKEEMGEPNALVVATGGLSELLQGSKKKIIDIIDRDLTLNGLKYIYDLNKEQ
ncbi:MAG: type III pantothenate kinase, partial [Clostridia bacterium]